MGTTLITDNDLKVIQFIKDGQSQHFCEKAKLVFDCGHKVLLDDVCRIKKFIFKKDNCAITKTMFSHAKCGYNTILFDDGTNVLQSGPEIVVTHDNKTIMYDKNQEFAATYNANVR